MYIAAQALSGSGIGKVKLVPVLLEKVNDMFVTQSKRENYADIDAGVIINWCGQCAVHVFFIWLQL